MSQNSTSFQRFALARRIEHIFLIVSFTLLAVTGLPQKFASAAISPAIINLFGGIEMVRVIHRAAAAMFLLESIYHLVVAGYKLYVQRLNATMLPGTNDVFDAINSILFNLGFRKERPKMGRYNFTEKAEYWAMVWGLVLMGLTGFILLNPIATTNLLPGQIIPAAKSAHGWEAVLAVLALILWHGYNVHLKAFNKSMFTGNISRHEMEEEHQVELEQIETGTARLPLAKDDPEYKRRFTVFVPTAVILTVALSVGVYSFLTFESTALETVPRDSIQVFQPQTPTPFPTPLPSATPLPPAPGAAALSWDGGIGSIFDQKCGACHGAAGGVGLKTFDAAMKGNASGPVILPGNAAESSLITLQQGGAHPGLFSAEELEQIIQWIDSGAPRN